MATPNYRKVNEIPATTRKVRLDAELARACVLPSFRPWGRERGHRANLNKQIKRNCFPTEVRRKPQESLLKSDKKPLCSGLVLDQLAVLQSTKGRQALGCKLYAPPSAISAVDASNVEVLGVTPVTVRVGNKCIEVTMYVLKHLRHTCLLGLDVLDTIGALIDLPGKQLILQDTAVPFSNNDWRGDGEVLLTSQHVVPPGETTIAEGGA